MNNRGDKNQQDPTTKREPGEPAEKKSNAVWATPTGVSLLVLMLSVLAYFIGMVRLDVYLGLHGIDWKIFPLDKPDYIYVGAVTVMDSLVSSLIAISQKWMALGAAMALGLLAAVITLLLDRLQARQSKTANAGKVINPWRKNFAFVSVITMGTPALMFFPILFLALVLVLPETIGEAVARRDFEKEKTVIAKGCKEATRQLRCFQLVESGKVMAQGFLLHASKDRVLIHDGTSAAVWSLEKRELVAWKEEPSTAMQQDATPAKMPGAVTSTP